MLGQVVEAALPPGISMATAQSVLFIGKAVRVLQRPCLTGRDPLATVQACMYSICTTTSVFDVQPIPSLNRPAGNDSPEPAAHEIVSLD